MYHEVRDAELEMRPYKATQSSLADLARPLDSAQACIAPS